MRPLCRRRLRRRFRVRTGPRSPRWRRPACWMPAATCSTLLTFACPPATCYVRLPLAAAVRAAAVAGGAAAMEKAPEMAVAVVAGGCRATPQARQH